NAAAFGHQQEQPEIDQIEAHSFAPVKIRRPGGGGRPPAFVLAEGWQRNFHIVIGRDVRQTVSKEKCDERTNIRPARHS
ncbi:hypothetical protein, partial [Mesorhizobium sp. M7D.F.Ca.US.004.01.2.1]|uniref:hypothetical protein n=1 Tax=Mesorhizobium sp. M7D.F.Ca.US.004.01.2.1 TaxID=2496738 RepID=UPI0019CF8CD6